MLPTKYITYLSLLQDSYSDFFSVWYVYQDGQSYCGSSLSYFNDLLRMKHSSWHVTLIEHSDKCASTNRIPY